MLNIVLWGLQILLAVAFLAHGWMFLAPPADMVQQVNAAIAPAFRVLIGVAEVLAAVGLTVPGITRIAPGLVPSAAAGLAIVMVSATMFHIMRGETSSAAVTAVLLALVTFVAYGRWKVLPILPRTVGARPQLM
jgi:putative oxidoreductase